MGKILEYTDLSNPPADADLLFMGDYSANASNPTTMRLKISDLNRKRNVDAADASGLKLRDDSGTYGIFIKDGGNVGIGTNSPDYKLDLETAAVGTANVRIYSNATNGYPHLVMKNDAATWSIYAPHGNFTGTGVADLFSIYNGSSHVLIIQTDGNVGIGVNPSSATVGYQLQVVGDMAATGTNDVIIDPSTGEVKSQSGLHLEKSAGQDVYVVGDSSAAAIYAKSSNKKVGINYISAPGARLHVYEGASATAETLFLHNYMTGGNNRAVVKLRQGESGSNKDNFIIWDGTQLGIRATNAALTTADTVNFKNGYLNINGNTFGQRLRIDGTTASGDNALATFISPNTTGNIIAIRNSSAAAAAAPSNIIWFSNTVSSTEKVNWIAGSFRVGSANFFGIHWPNSAGTGTNFGANYGTVAFDTSTLSNNYFYVDEDGGAHAKAFYNVSTTAASPHQAVGDYCRGRFVQTFSVPYLISVNSSSTYSPLFSTPINTTDGAGGADYITAKFASVAPHDGRIQKVRIAARNSSSSDNCNVDMYIYSQAALPAESVATYSLSTTTSDNFQNASIPKTSTAKNTIITKGYADFTEQTDTTTYPRSKLDFNQGDYLAFSMEADSGYAEATVTFTCEFYIDDTL